jgi:shikimate dehydrogenase
MDRYAVMGHPVSHSKSPLIHSLFAAQTLQHLRYDAIHVLPGGFEQAVRDFVADGGKGLNITLPFKEEAWSLVEEVTPRAQQAAAVNTISFDPGTGRTLGDNTDGAGLLKDLVENHAVALNAKRVLLVGAGGAARGVLGPLLGEHPAELCLVNRTTVRAHALAERFADQGVLRVVEFDELAAERFDIVINATSTSLHGELPPLPSGILRPGACCYDMMYAERATVFVQWGCEQGACTSVDGLGMLVEQAAESFYLWRGVRPLTSPVIQCLQRRD